MGRTTKTLLVAVAATGGAVAARRAVSARGQRRADALRRHVVTVNRPADAMMPHGHLPSPLADLGDDVEIDMRPAPGDRGTEIAVRSRTGAVSAGDIRRALRDTRSLLEAGDVLLPDGPPTTVPTWRNRALRSATRHGREGGLL